MKLPNIFSFLTSGERPPFEGAYIYIFMLLIAYMVGDLGALYARSYMIPTTPPPKKRVQTKSRTAQSYVFNNIIKNNIFNADRKKVPTLAEKEGGPQGLDGEPVKSNLPLTLVGTIVHSNPNRSIATILMKGKNKVEPYKVDENIGSMAEIKKIERERVVFINKRTRSLEYIEVPKDEKIVISTVKTRPTPIKKKASKTKFTFTRKEINKHLEDLPGLLQQARAVPEIGSDGQLRCYKLVSIKPGSVYEKIGVQKGDCILSVNSEEIRSPQKAMEMYQALKSSSELTLTVDRGGTEVDLKYDIR